MNCRLTILLLLFSFAAMAQGFNSTPYCSGSTVEKIDTIPFVKSNRMYLQLNQWRTYSNAYGVNFHQMNQGAGTGLNPSITRQRNGLSIPFSGELLNLSLNGYVNNSENMTIELEITCFTSTNNSNAVNVVWRQKETFVSNSTTAKLIDIAINKSVPKGSEIMLSSRKITGTGTTRYFYQNSTFYLKKD